MFVSNKEHELLKNRVKFLEEANSNLINHIIDLKKELHEIKTNKPKYFS